MTDRQIGEDEITGRFGTVQVYHASDGSASQDGHAAGVLRHSTLSNGTCLLESCKEEVVGIQLEGDVFLRGSFAFIDAQLDNRWRVYWATVGRSW